MSQLKTAPQHVQLAVDLIMLLEQNQVCPKLALDALQIVENDLKNKVNKTKAVKSLSDGKAAS
ncbi:hypothetical protein PALB_26350 [Pseudoalteromonas luteoviolacea B = ATCC 29581]|nr:hypothetical protein PALB_26350 [Pseudoalteromonas luteoviolacea B = ATCC 29581]